ncbi:hypothetical protein KUTeg_011769 [Tegillarca granosa]|uniref:Uncharacterized protein n=1 Tax=Tegillarca granosa TaxID=220873 RepID=A0ABQ9EXL3_TEGGR|nr:hypothetical protein KUTeg_011769 [Tegillarca granosa]
MYASKPGKEASIPLIDQFFAILVRLKVGLLLPDISQRLGISEETKLQPIFYSTYPATHMQEPPKTSPQEDRQTLTL